VVLVHGSGPNDRDESIGPNKPFRDLAWGLASRGIATLRYDKRTFVHGQAVVAQGDLTVNEETVDDALAAVALLRTIEGIEHDRIFVIGHSQGAYLAPRIGQRDPQIAGLILLAGNSRSLLALVPEQSQYLAALDGAITAEEQAALDDLTPVIEATQNVQPGDDPATLLFHAPAVYWIDLNAYDPVAVASTLAVPMLILQGERDYQVTMVDFAGWQAGLAARDNLAFKSYPGLNHLFISGEGPGSPAEYEIPGHVAERVVQDIADWILNR
jgi:alpha-beta hydrolase superfamily lysophospholipase